MKTVPKRCSTDGNTAARTFQKSYQAAVWSLLAGTPPPLDIRGRKNGTLSHSSLFFGQMPLWKYYMNFDNMLAKPVTLQRFRCLYEGTLLSLWHNCLSNLAVEMNRLTLIFLQLFFSSWPSLSCTGCADACYVLQDHSEAGMLRKLLPNL